MQYRDNHKRALASAIVSRKSFGTTLLAILLDAYDVDVLNVEPESLKLQIRQDFGVEVPKSNMDKMLAAVNFTVTNLPYTDLGTFIVTADSLSRDREANFQVISPTPIEDVAWAVTEMVVNDPVKSIPELSNRFSLDVLAYIGTCAAYSGLIEMPETLRFATIPGDVVKTFHDMADMKEVSEAILKRSTDRTEDINATVAANLAELDAQVKALPLSHRKRG